MVDMQIIVNQLAAQGVKAEIVPEIVSILIHTKTETIQLEGVQALKYFTPIGAFYQISADKENTTKR